MGKVYQRAVMWCPGIIFPTPYPQGYGATPPLPRPPQSACDVPGSMPEAAPYGNAGCVVHRARLNSGPPSVTSGRASTTGHPPASQSYGTARSAPKRGTPGRHGGATPENDAAAVFSCSPVPVARVVFGTSVTPAAGTPTDRIPPSTPVPPFPSRPAGSHPAHLATGGVRAQSHRRGRAPVKRRIQACATIYFQPTSHPCPFLGELADQPPCHQARRDQAVRFHPTGTGHECEAHFPARLLSETLRDRMLPAKLPCRHSAGWSTCHVGTAGRSRFDLGCRRLGTRARPRGNVQERQARKDQGDANTEGGLAS